MGGESTYGDGVSYETYTSGITIDFAAASSTTSRGGYTDALTDIEDILGSNLADTFNFVGDLSSGIAAVDGDGENDTFNIGDGTTTTLLEANLTGGAGNDFLNVAANATLTGNLEGGDGVDSVTVQSGGTVDGNIDLGAGTGQINESIVIESGALGDGQCRRGRQQRHHNHFRHRQPATSTAARATTPSP